MGRTFAKTVAGTIALLLVGASGALGQNGSITFSDSAPPPTETEKKRGQNYHQRASELADAVQRLATVMRATKSLSAAFDAVQAGSPGDIVGPSAAWKMASGSLITDGPPPAGASYHANASAAYIAATLRLAALIAAAPPAERTGDLRQAVDAASTRQGLLLDDMLAEHGQLNRALRYYPLSSLAQQVPLSCEFVNGISRDFRCLNQAQAPTLVSGEWCDVTDAVQSFSVAEWSAGTVMKVRKASFADHMLPGGTAGALIEDAHAQRTLKPQC